MALSVEGLIKLVIVAVVFGALIGTVADNTIGVSGTGNITGATSTMVVLVPLFLTIAVILGFVREARAK